MTRVNAAEKIKHLLTRNVEQVIDRAHLEKALVSGLSTGFKTGKKLRVKLGIDPTGGNVHVGQKVVPSGNIHVGRAVTLWKLKEFQDLGHTVVFIIGDFTAQIGDPSDKLQKRPFLTAAQVEKNLRNYLPQIGKIIDLKKAEIHYNSKWLSKLNLRETAELAETFSVNQMLRRHNFRERWGKGEEISVREFLYPVMQGYDSVMVKADVELGGTDQLFNLMAGREIQKHYGQEPQDIMTTKMLLGTDGRKMSTSWGNVINIFDSADEQFGKVMSLRDELIPDYFRMATLLPEKEITAQEKALKSRANPKDIKLILAKEIVALYHGKATAEKAAEKFNILHPPTLKINSHENVSVTAAVKLNVELPELRIKQKEIFLLDLVLLSGASKSKSEARRLILQGAVSVDDQIKKIPSEILALRGGETIKIGKKNFFRVKV